MKIGIDVTFLFDQYSHRGIGTYARQTISRMIQDEEHEWVLFGFKDLKSTLKELDAKQPKNVIFVSLGKPKDSNLFNPIFFNLNLRRKVLKANLDIFFAPHLERGLPIGKVTTAVMVHDVIPYLTNSYSQKNAFANYVKGNFYRRNLRNAMKAELILTNSEFTRKELIKKAGFPESSIEITPLAVSSDFNKELIQSDSRAVRRVLVMYKITQPYLLYYGGLEENKNVELLLQTFSKVVGKHPDLKLVISGKEFKLGWDGKPKPNTKSAERLLETIVDMKLQHKVVLTGEIKQVHLPLVLNNAECFISLSNYEGFGLSVLEAMTAGVPVVAANRSSYPEVLGNAAVLVDPKDTSKTAEKVLQILQDKAVHLRLVKAGQKEATKYNWESTAKLTTAAFVETVERNPIYTITYVIPRFFPEAGGAETNCLELAKRASQAGHSVRILTSTNESSLFKMEKYEELGIRRHRRINNQYYLGFYPGLFWTLLREKSDIIHVHGFGFIWQDLCLLFKKILSRKTIFINTPHGPFMAHGNYSLSQVLLKKIYTFAQRLFLNRLYDIVIQVNPDQYKWIKEYGIKTEKIKYLPNGINPEDLKPAKGSLGIHESKLSRKFIISFTGRFEEYKGIQQVIKILPKLVKVKPNLKFVVMGRGGNYLENIKTLAKNLEVEKYLHIIVNPEDKLRDLVLTQSKIFVMPSRWEAFGISILEAMAKKCAIVTSETEGGKFLVENKINGFLFDFDDEKGLYKSLESLVKDPKLLLKIQNNNFEKAKMYTWDEIAIDYEKILLEIK